MGLFDKKYCSICNNKIGLLGNRKLEDGNLCKDCAAKLSPWFSERRHSTVEEIGRQLQYREDNKAKVQAFHTTRDLGRYTRLLIDDNAQKFLVTSAKDLLQANPDVLDFDQATGCLLDIEESRSELKTKDSEGKSVSYNPPRYEYSYNFYVTIKVNNPYFDEMKFRLNSSAVDTGERSMAGAAGNWRITTSTVHRNTNASEYYEFLGIGNEIKEAVDGMIQKALGVQPAAEAPESTLPKDLSSYTPDQLKDLVDKATAEAQAILDGKPAGAAAAATAAVAAAAATATVKCPWCGSQTPAASGKCQFCGGPLE